MPTHACGPLSPALHWRAKALDGHRVTSAVGGRCVTDGCVYHRKTDTRNMVGREPDRVPRLRRLTEIVRACTALYGLTEIVRGFADLRGLRGSWNTIGYVRNVRCGSHQGDFCPTKTGG